MTNFQRRRNVQQSGLSRTYVVLGGPKSAVGHFTTE